MSSKDGAAQSTTFTIGRPIDLDGADADLLNVVAESTGELLGLELV